MGVAHDPADPAEEVAAPAKRADAPHHALERGLREIVRSVAGKAPGEPAGKRPKLRVPLERLDELAERRRALGGTKRQAGKLVGRHARRGAPAQRNNLLARQATLPD